MRSKQEMHATEERTMKAMMRYQLALAEVIMIVGQMKHRDPNPLTAGPFIRDMQAAFVKLSEAADECAMVMGDMAKFCDEAVAEATGQQPGLPS